MAGRESRFFGKTARASVVVAVAVLIAACTPAPPLDGTPAIFSFSADVTSGSAPLTTAFTWSIGDADTPVLTCRLDLDGDGTYEVTISSCTSDSVRSATFTSPGTHTARLQVSDGTTTVTSDPVALSVGTASADSYAITIRFNGTLTGSQQAAFNSAAARWSQVIRTGLSDLPVNVPANLCGSGAPAFSGTVDDLLIDASIVAIDGQGGILGSAGPCLTRQNGGLPVYGAMRFDTADVADLEADGQFEAVILHEMGHVLGLGTVWTSHLSGILSGNPVFTGLAARGAWDAVVGGSGVSVPVENMGGPGTALGHWRESVFDNELMTGYLDSGSNPLSAITVGALGDLGYGVDLAAADPYGTPALHRPATPETQLRTELIFPTGQVPG